MRRDEVMIAMERTAGQPQTCHKPECVRSERTSQIVNSQITQVQSLILGASRVGEERVERRPRHRQARHRRRVSVIRLNPSIGEVSSRLLEKDPRAT
jgi:hypothetical protein